MITMSKPALVFAVFSALIAPLMRAQDLPSGKGKEALDTVCTTCHDLAGVASKASTSREGWLEIINDMKERGAAGSDEEFRSIVNYLVKFLGPPVEVNSATADELVSNLDITDKEAEAIVKYRTDKGNFKTWADLQKVPGLDIKQLEPIKSRFKF